jgi:hypothetical protein
VIVTGYAAVRGYGPEETHVIHLLVAELLLVYAPFGKIGHVVVFFVARAFHGAESARRGVAP